MTQAKQEISSDLKLVIVLVLLFVLYPVGLILMFKWMTWPKWVKWLIALPVAIFLLCIFITMVGGLIFGLSGNYSSRNQLEDAENRLNNAVYQNTCTKQCAATKGDMDKCIQKCLQDFGNNSK
ncbi:MAG TPA: hypothetical protein VL401_03595 [Alphaproteobacteria bacterium]|jgi:hypothetical protein|nr:hypothetical protein [Alphaproteobacteria bacterium]